MKSIAIIGLSRFGLSLVEAFSKLDVELVAIDMDEEQVRKAGDFIQNVFIADSTSIESLRAAGIANVDHAIVAIGQNERINLTTSIISVIKLKELGIKEITARADEEDYAEVLTLVGATNIVMPLDIAAERIANKIAAGNVLDYFNVRRDYDVYEVKISDDFEPLPIINLDSRTRYKINILLIERNKVLYVPTKDTILEPGDEIFVFGKKQDIPKVLSVFN
ncbi:MAG TPA: TrkA family potassium uptake protein [Bacilli bacterium]|jgi:trk system potassium uptake protein TrkA|nr:TrkA family potassium uptake protein [Erysipelotrichaceae bacterium]OQC49362.1 MAG: Ktr system potassium uptake protein A [Tenericutes bacterium ADurb.Bin024]TAH58775.1 MAG: TrkA family potassium uptake protein [Bacillota bacterium]HOA11320.1 TrkA family potassium uptake protein [Bacilli bacterium]HOE54367.1 TrkA family potassium uptake protein [Bacilli bacterium]